MGNNIKFPNFIFLMDKTHQNTFLFPNFMIIIAVLRILKPIQY